MRRRCQYIDARTQAVNSRGNGILRYNVALRKRETTHKHKQYYVIEMGVAPSSLIEILLSCYSYTSTSEPYSGRGTAKHIILNDHLVYAVYMFCFKASECIHIIKNIYMNSNWATQHLYTTRA